MNREFATFQNLICALDDTAAFYTRTETKVTSPYFGILLKAIAKTHQQIADELAESMAATGNGTTRGGSLLGSLRTFGAQWRARFSSDIELGYAIRIGECEDHVWRRCRDAIAGAMDVELRHGLELHHREIERASMNLAYLASLLGLQANPTSTRAHTIASLSERREVRRRAARELERFEV